MNAENVVGLILAAALIVFLVAALLFPAFLLVRANARHPNRPKVADLKVAVKSVTYRDGTTSTTP